MSAYDMLTEEEKKQNVRDNYMRFITGIHVTKDMLRALNGITFLFDPNWSAENNTVSTLPVCFFSVKGYREVMESEVSQKTMLLYEDNSSLSSTAVTGGLTNVVADNIVIRPKQYKIDAIVPYSDLTLLSNSYMMSSNQISAIATFLTSYGTDGGEQIKNTAAYINMATPYIKAVNAILNMCVSANFSATAFGNGFLNSVLSTPDFNKNSLEAMWRNRSILKMKIWNGWQYKYVAIDSIDISKEPTEEGVYEATITAQEMPILTYRRAGNTKIPYKNPLVTAAGKLIINALDLKEE